ncbi:hypothetical protein SAMN04515692_11226 [Leifsonia sp. CL147]|nr:hypothetical protein SAMN04515694_11226 [Leifsonia sp. CL154]SFL76990.1 hypothetical protein SAMN04515692_11226 [Leifsonia sp. CL147]
MRYARVPVGESIQRRKVVVVERKNAVGDASDRRKPCLRREHVPVQLNAGSIRTLYEGVKDRIRRSSFSRRAFQPPPTDSRRIVGGEKVRECIARRAIEPESSHVGQGGFYVDARVQRTEHLHGFDQTLLRCPCERGRRSDPSRGSRATRDGGTSQCDVDDGDRERVVHDRRVDLNSTCFGDLLSKRMIIQAQFCRCLQATAVVPETVPFDEFENGLNGRFVQRPSYRRPGRAAGRWRTMALLRRVGGVHEACRKEPAAAVRQRIQREKRHEVTCPKFYARPIEVHSVAPWCRCALGIISAGRYRQWVVKPSRDRKALDSLTEATRKSLFSACAFAPDGRQRFSLVEEHRGVGGEDTSTLAHNRVQEYPCEPEPAAVFPYEFVRTSGTGNPTTPRETLRNGKRLLWRPGESDGRRAAPTSRAAWAAVQPRNDHGPVLPHHRVRYRKRHSGPPRFDNGLRETVRR